VFAALASALRGGALPACTHIDLALAIRAAAPPSVREALASPDRARGGTGPQPGRVGAYLLCSGRLGSVREVSSCMPGVSVDVLCGVRFVTQGWVPLAKTAAQVPG
jgi:hypothetical protein